MSGEQTNPKIEPKLSISYQRVASSNTLVKSDVPSVPMQPESKKTQKNKQALSQLSI